MAENKPIGRLLEELGFINSDQIEVALDVQKASPKFLGEIFQDLDFITSNEIAEAIAIQNNLEYIDMEQIVPSPEALKLVPQNIATTRSILPISVDETYLVVATQEVNDLMTHDYLRKISQKQIKFVVGDKKAIARYAEIYYHQLENPIEVEIKEMVKQTLDGNEIDLPHLVNLLLNNAIKDRVTDIHVTPESTASHIFYRIDGVLQHYYSLPLELHQQIAARIKILSDLDISEQRRPQDGAFSYEFLNEDFDLRVSTLPTNFGENIVMRLLGKNASLFSLTHLGLSEENSKKVENYFTKPYGIILVVGPTGSGKTTTLYSALRKVDSLKKNVMTIEDPIEYKFSFIRQTQLNEKAGYDFNAAIRAFMRQDPDVMLVGEIRDSETAELAIRASITGHLVLSTLHTNDAVGTIPRLGDLDIPPYLIGSGLLAILAQRLVRKLCLTCKKKVEMTHEELTALNVTQRVLSKHPEPTIYEAVGCNQCHNTGYTGRQAIIEILDVDEDIEAMISAKATTLEILKVAHKKGMHSMKEDGFDKVLKGVTTFAEIERVVN
jgi:type IV pilus assembly protein PilB